MKRIILISHLFVIFRLDAQVLQPVKWQCGLKKIENGIFEVHLRAIIEKGWHTYSEKTPDGGPLPTHIVFKADDYLLLENVKENGMMKTKYEKAFGVNINYFEEQVDFIQKIKIKKSPPGYITGTIEYMACNDRQCLSPETIHFSIPFQRTQ